MMMSLYSFVLNSQIPTFLKIETGVLENRKPFVDIKVDMTS